MYGCFSRCVQARESSDVQHGKSGAAPGDSDSHAASDIILQGWVEKKSGHGLTGLKRWAKRWFVLRRSTRSLHVYANMVCCTLCGTLLRAAPRAFTWPIPFFFNLQKESIFGVVPLDERGALPLEYIRSVTIPESKDKYKGECVHRSRVMCVPL